MRSYSWFYFAGCFYKKRHIARFKRIYIFLGCLAMSAFFTYLLDVLIFDWSAHELKLLLRFFAGAVFMGTILIFVCFRPRGMTHKGLKQRQAFASDYARIHEIVRQRTADLQAANQELEAFSYSVSHDLRAPLRSINGFSHALLEDYFGKLDAKGMDYLNRIAAASVRMENLIDDLLTLSSITKHPLSVQTVDISKLAEQVAENLKRNHYHFTEFRIAPGLTATGDSGLLFVVFENLFENAAKYSRDVDHPEVEFGRNLVNGRQVFYIRDNGVGFDMQYADKLFGAFQRLHTSKEFEGTGIGLATVKRIILRHNGEIWTESKVGGGSVFYFTLNS